MPIGHSLVMKISPLCSCAYLQVRYLTCLILTISMWWECYYRVMTWTLKYVWNQVIFWSCPIRPGLFVLVSSPSVLSQFLTTGTKVGFPMLTVQAVGLFVGMPRTQCLTRRVLCITKEEWSGNQWSRGHMVAVKGMLRRKLIWKS